MTTSSARYLRAVVRRYLAGDVTPRHDHPWPQLAYASSGVMAVEAGSRSWIVCPQRAIWVPPRTRHLARMLTDVSVASLYLPKTRGSPTECEVMEICPLTRELLLAAERFDFSRNSSRRGRALATLIGEELAAAPRDGSSIPMPGDRRLLVFCQRILRDPSLRTNLDEHARAIGITPKTISRLFNRELGMSFRRWRTLVQSSYAFASLVQGEPVKVIASNLGYTPSAFSVMMKRNLHCTPASLRNETKSPAQRIRNPTSAKFAGK